MCVCVQVITCNFQMVQGLETIKQTLNVFNVYRTATTIKVSVNMESWCLTRAVSDKCQMLLRQFQTSDRCQWSQSLMLLGGL